MAFCGFLEGDFEINFDKKLCLALPGFIFTVEEGRWEVEPGEKEESTVEDDVWWEGRMGGD